MIKVIATDLDNTLVRDHKITEENLKVLDLLYQQGIKIIISSGRFPLYIHWLLDKYNIKADICALNGAYVSLNNGKKLYESLIDPQIALQMEEFLIKYNYYFHIYNYDSIFATHLRLHHIPHQRTKEGIRFFYNVYLSKSPIQDGIRLGKGIYKIFISRNGDDHELMNFLKNTMKINISSSGDDNLEINSIHTNKMKGIEHILSDYGLSRNNLLAIGDHTNDLPMICSAKIGVAMGNSHKRLKEQANYVTLDYDKNGFAAAMNKYIIGGFR